MARQTRGQRGQSTGKTDICMTVEKQGVWVYGNRAAFQRMAARLAEIAETDPSEHYELHLRWHLGSHFAKRQAVFVLVHPEVSRCHAAREFELTFMMAEGADLAKLRRHERSGRLPAAWRKSED